MLIRRFVMGVNDSSLRFGVLSKGKLNLITDVPGVKTGHATLSHGDVQTGVTAIIPGSGSAFRDKFPAAVTVINGFGKSIGLMQIQELGTLETPILLTNTFSVPACAEGLLTYMLDSHSEIGTTTGTVNPVVMECNDSKLNDIRGRHVTSEDALEALKSASSVFEEGAVGAGRGMCCYGFKGGIGSASRVIEAGSGIYTVGSLLLTNFGRKIDLAICGRSLFRDEPDSLRIPDKGSCIMIIATDLPLSCRQLARCCRRAQNGLARTGSITTNGSGEVVLAFSTVNRVPHSCPDPVRSFSIFDDNCLDVAFRAVSECVEESVISSLLHAESVTGRDNNTVLCLNDYLKQNP